MKIGLYLTPGRNSHTGITNYRHGMLKALAEIDPTLEFLDAHWSGWKPASITQQPTIPPHSSSRWSLGRGLSTLRKNSAARHAVRGLQNGMVRRVIKSGGISLFHAFNFLPPTQPIAPSLPVIYDLSFVRYPEMHPKERLRVLEKLPYFVANAPLVHTISEFSKNEIAEIYNYRRDRIVVAYPAADPIFRPLGLETAKADLTKLDLIAGSFFLTVGTIEPRKNLASLISAYSELSLADRQRLPLVIVGGEGWGNSILPSRTESLVREGSLRFLGFVKNEVLRSLYQTTALMLYPSIYEGFGMPVLEAMACGATVAHSSNTSMDEITDISSIRIDALDVDGWSACMRRTADQDINSESNKKNIKLAASFAWLKTAAIIRNAYSRILEG